MEEQNEVDLSNYNKKIKDIDILIEYLGIEPIVKISLPTLNVIGSKHTLIQDERIKIIFENKISSDILSKNIDNLYQKSISFGSIKFKRGDYFIDIINSKYFKIRSLLLETNSKFTNIIEENIKNDSYFSLILRKRISYIILLILLVIFCKFNKKTNFIIKIHLKKISTLLAYWNNLYWLLTDKTWILIWMIFLIMLIYAKYISIHNVEIDSGYIGIILLIIYWHFIRIIKKNMIENFNKLSNIIYYRESTPFFINGLLNLIITVFFLVAKKEKIAEFVSMIMYFNLFIAILIDINNLKKKSKKIDIA
jgi:hypothetical protein